MTAAHCGGRPGFSARARPGGAVVHGKICARMRGAPMPRAAFFTGRGVTLCSIIAQNNGEMEQKRPSLRKNFFVKF